MNANEIVLKFTLDIKGIKSAINQVEKDLKKFGSESQGATQGLNNALEETEQQLDSIATKSKNFANNASQSFNKFRVSAGAAGGSAIAFNRIIQDAPFGIIGVANNIQQFAEQLSALRVTTGSTAAALGTFFKSLFTGTNLVILGVSAVTAAFTAYQLGAFDSAEETKDLNKELEDFKNNLDGVSKAQLEGAQSAQTEIQALKLLRLQAENVKLSDEQRLLAVKKIKEEYPGLLKGYTDEQILLGNVGDAYDKVTKSIIAKSKAVAFSQTITENEKKTLTLLLQEEQRALEILAKRAELEKARIGEQTSALKVAGQFTASNIEANKIEAELNDLIQQTVDSAEERKKIALETLSIEAKIPAEIEKAGGLIDSNTQSAKETTKEFDLQAQIIDRFNQKIDLSKELTEGLTKTQKTLFESIASLKQAGDVGFNPTLLAIYEQKLAEIDKLIGSIASKRKETDVPIPTETAAGITPDVPPIGKIEGLQQKIADIERLREVTSDPAKYNEQIANLRIQLQELTNTKDQTTETINAIVDAFSSLGAGIAASLNIGDRALRGFVTTLLSQTPKIIAALSKQADSNLSNAGKNIAADKAESISSGIKQGTKFAEALGPVGLALLPVLIAGAVAVISSAFSKTGSGGSASPGVGSTFTNREFGGPVSKGRAYIVGERRPELFVPNTNGIIVPQLPSMDYSGASMSASNYGVDIRLKGPDDLLFFVEQAQIRRGLR
jgi:hypothetical protein